MLSPAECHPLWCCAVREACIMPTATGAGADTVDTATLTACLHGPASYTSIFLISVSESLVAARCVKLNMPLDEF
jgi:hypothetical protein